MSRIVEIENLTKSYGNVMAVDHISFSLEEGKIYGLLGRNGAGKTTIMHLITAQLFPTSGGLKVFGEDPYENARVLSQICFVKESEKYPDSYRVVDVMEISASLLPNWDRQLANSLIEDFRLPLKRRMKKLSRGMVSSVGIVVGLASRAPLTIFDEPYLGLDAVARSLFYDRLLEDYSLFPRTVILSTHLIDEVSRMLEHVLVIDKGRMIVDEDTELLRGKAFNVVGPVSKVEAFTAGKEIIYREPFGRLASITVIGKLSPIERKQAEELELELTMVSLQHLIVYMTSGISERKAAEAR